MSNGEFDTCSDEYMQIVVKDAQSLYKSKMRRMEYICERALLRELTGEVDMEIMHNADGKPLLMNGSNISISHTRGFVAIILSEKKNVGIDIEYVHDRVMGIANRFMREDESASDIKSLLIHWCAKETIYKLFSSEHLDFKDIKVCMGDSPFVTNMKDGTQVKLYVESSPDYVLTYSVR